ncbi:uncharacterized protein Z519_12789 [Cladophialophora bantiana CBS 173.52]|uniref:Uncharacterized protein n=1 Tax=Cladophialophora bantiana (strain ATCC 10958 / CBS 173.52 / CDC B-1940 / NIH 8579) TaxID=1442370 RepID=A0A0D2H6W3_CLAB1|nr:uncharacterized protein Z519_12789 [Cladophialophora bantiana CBS 173.52]KIW86605.1 hypothetical protein Z519_12789 [Cladophialophora bantiana CBS 173.52]
MGPTIVLISGANRGIGRGLLERYIARPNHVIIAANRDPDSASSKELTALPRGLDSRVIVVKIDAKSETDASDAAKELKERGIDYINLVIANAGVAYAFGSVANVDINAVRGHIEPNVYGVVRLYQAMQPLLLRSVNPKWVTMGSIAGSIESLYRLGEPLSVCAALSLLGSDSGRRNQPAIDNCAYGPSKAAIHWFTKRMNGEEERLTAFVAHPGWVQTDMGDSGARVFGLEHAPDSLPDSCDGMIKLFDEAAKETHGGKLWQHDGIQLPW